MTQRRDPERGDLPGVDLFVLLHSVPIRARAKVEQEPRDVGDGVCAAKPFAHEKTHFLEGAGRRHAVSHLLYLIIGKNFPKDTPQIGQDMLNTSEEEEVRGGGWYALWHVRNHGNPAPIEGSRGIVGPEVTAHAHVLHFVGTQVWVAAAHLLHTSPHTPINLLQSFKDTNTHHQHE